VSVVFQTLKGSLQTLYLALDDLTLALGFKPSKDRYKLQKRIVIIVNLLSFKPSKDRYKP